MNKHLGKHIFFDFFNFKSSETDQEKAENIFNIMVKAIETKTNMKIVHKQLTVFDPKETLPGFTSVLLLDASHFTAHAYTDEKALLALDIFTCGSTNTEDLADHVIREITHKYNNIILSKYTVNNRFRIK